MSFRIEVREREGLFDAIGEGLKKSIIDLGIETVSAVRFIQVYLLFGNPTQDEIETITHELLYDRISQEARIVGGKTKGFFDNTKHAIIEVAYNPGVMDPVEDSALKAIRDRGIHSITALRTAKKYVVEGALSQKELTTICEKLLYNKTIEHIVSRVKREDVSCPVNYQFKRIEVPLIAAGDEELRRRSREGQLFLNLIEMRAIRDYFRSLGRNPTDCELETIAQTWSEHCCHKTFRGVIEYKEKVTSHQSPATSPKLKNKKINNLLKSTIMKATKELNKDWCVSVFKDNSGVIGFDRKYDVCFKVETHNHPSALEPFGGANTGIGGVIRDIVGTGLGAKPILNTDVFCFGPIDYPMAGVPKGSLHPKRVMKGVVSGVRDYGNKMGIPTVNGAVLFHESFIGNPLVYCGTAGIIPKGKAFKKAKAGDLVVVVGGRTGRDGIHGATFSSGELTHESEELSGGAVQIGNPITEKKMTDVLLKARDEELFNAITDCGAGGLSSAVGEMASELGCVVDLDKVPLKYQGLRYDEIWISEAQERMVVAVPKDKFERLKALCDSENVEMTAIGEFQNTQRLKLCYNGTQVCDLDMEFLHEGTPRYKRKAVWAPQKHAEPRLAKTVDCGKALKEVLGHPNICSKEWIIRQYDHEVQGGSVIKPLCGSENDGPSDAAIVRPILDSRRGVIVSCGINFRYGLIDPYWMAASCIEEALRQVVAVGGSLKQTALLDNFCWGNPDKADRLAGIVRASYACYDFSKYFSVPFISGKDSLNNEYTVAGRSIPIAGTLLISAISVMENIEDAVTSDFKEAGNLIYIVGQTKDELGGSCYYDRLGCLGANVPGIDTRLSKKIMEKLSAATQKRIVRACHDCSDGGLAVALAEMCFAGGLGAEIFLQEVPCKKSAADGRGSKGLRDDTILFSESNSRFVVEVPAQRRDDFEKLLKGLPLGLIGCVSVNPRLKIYGTAGSVVIDERSSDLKQAWQKTLQL